MNTKEILILSNIFTIIIFIVTLLFYDLKINNLTDTVKQTSALVDKFSEETDSCLVMVESLNHYLDKIETKGKL